ncbi:hypothetical protein EYV94_07435 [Puteibacter caeruleilacunae]|nr:hypothetical protein EYV94_07435 [Puteibacter caeruleilacunae]
MQIRLLLVLLILPLGLLAQTGLNKVDAAGKKQGKWIVKYPNNKTRYTATFKDGYPEGKMIRYYENGVKKAEMEFSEKGKLAQTTLFSEMGRVYAKGLYKNMKKQGPWEFYNKGRKVVVQNYLNGLKDGKTNVLFPSGKTYQQIGYKNDKIDGCVKIFDLEGHQISSFSYVEGVRQGECKTWTAGGEVEMVGEYNNNLPHGSWKFFNDEGEVDYELKYDNGDILNPEVLEKRDEEKFKRLEAQKLKLQDPEEFVKNPVEVLKRK